jgi:hypothetical protein
MWYVAYKEEDQLVEALQLLHCLGAINQDGNVTQLGTQVNASIRKIVFIEWTDATSQRIHMSTYM